MPPAISTIARPNQHEPAKSLSPRNLGPDQK